MSRQTVPHATRRFPRHAASLAEFSDAALVVCFSLLAGCGSEPVAPGKAPTKVEAPAKSEAQPGDKTAGKTFAQPKAAPPPAPEGSTLLASKPLYVQTCAEEHPCADLLQPAGETHCRDLTLGGRENWRLPDRDEVEMFSKIQGELEQLEGFHWTRTIDEGNAKQSWIVDPVGGQKTTIPRDRKPFKIRCVHEP